MQDQHSESSLDFLRTIHIFTRTVTPNFKLASDAQKSNFNSHWIIHEGIVVNGCNSSCRLKPTLQIAVEGCCHGELDAIYNHIHQLEARDHYKVELLLICGDFQAVRNHQDLQCMAVPDKYKELRHFYK
jgi:hypothetical protein